VGSRANESRRQVSCRGKRVILPSKRTDPRRERPVPGSGVAARRVCRSAARVRAKRVKAATKQQRGEAVGVWWCFAETVELRSCDGGGGRQAG